jgi:hypothetical protein
VECQAITDIKNMSYSMKTVELSMNNEVPLLEYPRYLVQTLIRDALQTPIKADLLNYITINELQSNGSPSFCRYL